MARTDAGTQLTAAHKQAQHRIATATVAHTIAVWSMLDITDLDGTVGRWLPTMLAVIHSQRVKSSAAAATYLEAFRRVETGQRFAPVLADPADEDQLTTSLMVTGPIGIKANMARGVNLAKASDLAVAAVAGAAMRHVLSGGRETVKATTRADPRSGGWVRVVSPTACDFCSNLADAPMTPESDFESHDACTCSNEPQYGN